VRNWVGDAVGIFEKCALREVVQVGELQNEGIVNCFVRYTKMCL
jgi:hypothetical protein